MPINILKFDIFIRIIAILHNMMTEDPYHCNCFVISPEYSDLLEHGLTQGGYFQPPQENHGQKFGLATNIDETLQFHIKTMPDGKIEAEIEPRIKFIEHLNQKYSSPAHFQVKQVLDALRIPYTQISHSITCISGKIKRPSKTTSVAAVIVGAIVVVGFLVLLIKK